MDIISGAATVKIVFASLLKKGSTLESRSLFRNGLVCRNDDDDYDEDDDDDVMKTS